VELVAPAINVPFLYQLYKFPPEVVKVSVLPSQIFPDDGEMFATGNVELITTGQENVVIAQPPDAGTEYNTV
jgi:hypothetical protein